MVEKMQKNIPQCPFYDPETWYCTARHTFHYEAHRPYCTRCGYFEKIQESAAGRQRGRKAS